MSLFKDSFLEKTYWLLKPVNLENFSSNHKPVLLTEVIDLLNPKQGESYLDLTAGGGGHARKIAKIVTQDNMTLVDADPQVAENLKNEFAQATIYNNDFADQILKLKNQSRRFDMILADLGLSSLQLNALSRGFSFLKDGPLDMRFNNQRGLSLEELLDRTSAVELENILREYGQERSAREISRRIKSLHPKTTLELAQLIVRVKLKNSRKSRIHPATKTFMALRIWVNDELKQLEDLLQIAPLLLNPAGRLAVISFHSLEDRPVKHAFRDLADGDYDCSYFIKSTKPIIPSIKSLAAHPQARSAKLRVLQRH